MACLGSNVTLEKSSLANSVTLEALSIGVVLGTNVMKFVFYTFVLLLVELYP